MSNAQDVEQGYVAFAALDLAHVGPVDAGLVGQSFLRKPASFSLPADRLPKLEQVPVDIRFA